MSAGPRNVRCESVVFKRWMHWCVLVPKKRFGVTPPIVPLPVVVRLGEESFESTLSSQDPEHYVLVVPVGYLRALELGVGDRLKLALEPDLARQAPEIPPEVAAFFREAGLLTELQRMTVASQRQVMKYLLGVAGERSRRNRMELMAERLRARSAARAKRARG